MDQKPIVTASSSNHMGSTERTRRYISKVLSVSSRRWALILGAVIIVSSSAVVTLYLRAIQGSPATVHPPLTTSSTPQDTAQPGPKTDTAPSSAPSANKPAATTLNSAKPAPKPSPPAPANPTPSAPAVTPTPPPPAPTACPNASHTPGGPDGMGGCWPYAGTTGVPSGTVLSAYSGSCSIHSSVVIENKTVNCALQIYSNASVTIRRSVVNGFVENTASNGTGRLIIEDSEIRAGGWSDGAVWGSYMNVARTEVTGGQHSVHCETDCTITDSWLHDQYNPNGGSYHNNAFLSNGGSGYTLRHNTLHCSAILNATDGGCTGDLTLLGDFDAISYATIDANLMMANNSSISYCTYGGYSPGKPYPNAHHVVYTNNIFQRGPNNKCGVYGAVTSFQTNATGNVWTNNKWSDGSILNP